MANHYVHTCVRVRDPDASQRFYEALGFEPRGRLNFETAYNLYMGLPGDGDVLELTVNLGREQPYDLGTGYNHMVRRGAQQRPAGGSGPRQDPAPPASNTVRADHGPCP